MTKQSSTETMVVLVYRQLDICELPASLTIEQCANALAMSMTSFRRKLALEGTSFKLIQNKFLNELCVHALLNVDSKIDDIASRLGYSERATFERAFRNKFGITPSQFRELSLTTRAQSNFEQLSEVAEHMPPMPDSCRQMIRERERNCLDLQRIVDIISQDVVFSGRILGEASRAIYGRTPQTLSEAISRNLGIDSVVNFAVVFAVQDALHGGIVPAVVNQYRSGLMLAPKLFKTVRKQLPSAIKFDLGLVEQLLIFAMLGIFLLSHKDADKHELMLYALKGIDDLYSLNLHILEVMGISLFSASTLILSVWHIDANVVKYLSHLDKVSRSLMKGSTQDDTILFMLSCLYFSARKNDDFLALEQKAELLNIENLTEIKQLLLDTH